MTAAPRPPGSTRSCCSPTPPGPTGSTLLAHPDVPVSPESAARFEDDVARRLAGEPVAYIRGIKEFFGIALSIDARALIPRPETERLVELVDCRDDGPTDRHRAGAATTSRSGSPTWARAAARSRSASPSSCAGDVSRSGSRCACSRPISSPDALDLARENAVAHGVADAMRVRRRGPPAARPARRSTARRHRGEPPVRPIRGDRRAADRRLVRAAAALDGGPDGLDRRPGAAGAPAGRPRRRRRRVARDRRRPGRRGARRGCRGPAGLVGDRGDRPRRPAARPAGRAVSDAADRSCRSVSSRSTWTAR